MDYWDDKFSVEVRTNLNFLTSLESISNKGPSLSVLCVIILQKPLSPTVSSFELYIL